MVHCRLSLSSKTIYFSIIKLLKLNSTTNTTWRRSLKAETCQSRRLFLLFNQLLKLRFLMVTFRSDFKHRLDKNKKLSLWNLKNFWLKIQTSPYAWKLICNQLTNRSSISFKMYKRKHLSKEKPASNRSKFLIGTSISKCQLPKR